MTVIRQNHLHETVIIDADEEDVDAAVRTWDSDLNEQRLLDLATKHGIKKDRDAGRWIWDTVKLMAEERYRQRTGVWSAQKTKEIDFIGSAIEQGIGSDANMPDAAEDTSEPAGQ